MATTTVPYSPAELKQVVAVQFAIWSPEEIERAAVCKVESAESYITEEGKNGSVSVLPRPGGVSDPNMGTSEYDAKCLSCHCNLTDCPGHFGYIDLARPVFHIGYFTTVLKILRCVCLGCSRLLVDPNDKKVREVVRYNNPVARLRGLIKLCDGKSKCAEVAEPKEDGDEGGEGAENASQSLQSSMPRGGGGCGAPKGRVSRVRGSFKVEVKYGQKAGESGTKSFLSADEVKEILRNIPDEHIRLMGFSTEHCRPEWMIMTKFPVPPPPVRPAVLIDAVTRSDDDLTHKIKDIVKTNNELKRRLNGAQHLMQETVELLQYHCATFINNELNGMPPARLRSGRALKSIRERLKGKAGRVRQNLMGKRVDASARTVITADPNLALDELGVPTWTARTLTFPEKVTQYNLKQMQRLVNNGPNEHPGAKFIVRADGRRVNLAFVKNTKDIHLEPGWTVERHISDGDVVLFNRQPTLHRMSMMGHRVRVLPYSTFRLNLSVTTPYNADFDGDEMNCHVPQSLLTKAELMHVMMVPKHIVTPMANKPCMGIVQDALLGCNRLTKRDTFLDRPLMMQCMMHVPDAEKVPVPAILKALNGGQDSGPLWTGKQLFSMIIPAVNRVGKSVEHPDNEPDQDLPVMDTSVLVKQGELITGIMDKGAVGNGGGSLVHIIFNEFGPEKAKWFITNVQRVVNNWLVHVGFSVGCGDTIANEKVFGEINAIIAKCKEDVKKAVKKAQEGTLETMPGKSIQESFEKIVNETLNKAREDAGKAACKSLSRSNRFRIMVAAGSKGNTVNIAQIAACVGQQNVEGKRIPFGFRRRTLPHFTLDDHGPESRGFVENCYLRGLTPQEMYFHAMGGREGLIDTAVKTAETGYIQRKLIKAMEDVTAMYDGTVRDSTGRIIQFMYGEDGMDGARLEGQKFDLMGMSNAEMDKKYQYEDPGNPNFGHEWLSPTVREQLLKEPLHFQRLQQEYDELQHDREFLRTFAFRDGDAYKAMPVNLDRLLENARTIFNIENTSSASDLHPIEVVEALERLKSELLVVRGKNNEDRQRNATHLFNLFLRSRLASKRVIKEHRLDRQAFEWLLGEVRERFFRAQVHPGEMVGSIAAQSCGEPATQMTLNTFHFAGVSSKNVTLGVPRLRELINIAKTPKQQGLVIWLDDKSSEDQEAAKRVQTQIEFTTLRHITKSVEIIYDPRPDDTVVASDREFVQNIWDWSLIEETEAADRRRMMQNMSPWVLRLELVRESVWDKELDLEEIRKRIKEKFPRDVWVETSDDNDRNIGQVLRLRLVNEEEKELENQEHTEDSASSAVTFLKQLEHELLDALQLRGIPNIRKCTMSQEKRVVYNQHTGAPEREPHKPWVLNTDGSALLRVLGFPHVDPTRTTCNNICEITEVLGIEAVRNALYKEIKFVYTVYGISIGYRHYSILCDVMTNKGYLMAISRHGINRSQHGPLMRCSYEETVEILFQAAAFGEKDPMRGVSANIMMGKQARAGTGVFDIILDEEMLEREHADIKEIKQVNAGFSPYSSPASYVSGGSQGSHDQFSPASPANTVYGLFSPGGQSLAPYSPGSRLSPLDSMMSPRTVQFSPASAASSPGGSEIMSVINTPMSMPFTPGSAMHTPGTHMSPGFPMQSPGHLLSPASAVTMSPATPASAGEEGSQGHLYSPASPGSVFSPGMPFLSPGGLVPSPQSRSPPSEPHRGMGHMSPIYSPAPSAGGGFSPGGVGGTSPVYGMGGITSPSFTPTMQSINQSPAMYGGASGYQAMYGGAGAAGGPASPSYAPQYPPPPSQQPPWGQ